MRAHFTDAELAACPPELLLETIDPRDLVEDPHLLSPEEIEEELVDIGQCLQRESAVLEDLWRAGFRSKLLTWLHDDERPVKEAVPILMRHLESASSPELKQELTATLAPVAPPSAWAVLRREFDQAPKGTYFAEAILYALSVAARREHVADLLDLLGDPSNGRSRTMLVRPAWRWGDDNARQALLRWKDDKDLRVEIGVASRRRAPRSR